MNRAARSAATIRPASRIGRRMASCSAGVNDFCGRDNGEPQLGPNGSIESDPAIPITTLRVRSRAGSLPIESYR